MSSKYGKFLYDWSMQKYAEDTSPIIKFLRERCKLGHGWNDKPFYVQKFELLYGFRLFMKAYSSKKKFYQKLKSLDVLVKQRYFRDEKGINKKKWCYIGIRLLTKEELKGNE